MRDGRRLSRAVRLAIAALLICIVTSESFAGFDQIYVVAGQPEITDSEEVKDREFTSRGAIGLGVRRSVGRLIGVGFSAWHIVSEVVTTSTTGLLPLFPIQTFVTNKTLEASFVFADLFVQQPISTHVSCRAELGAGLGKLHERNIVYDETGRNLGGGSRSDTLGFGSQFNVGLFYDHGSKWSAGLEYRRLQGVGALTNWFQEDDFRATGFFISTALRFGS